MTVTIRNTSPSRVVVESDGCSAYYGGALVQGNIICRVSMPAALAQQYVDTFGTFDLSEFARDVQRHRDGSPLANMRGVRVLEWRRVQ